MLKKKSPVQLLEEAQRQQAFWTARERELRIDLANELAPYTGEEKLTTVTSGDYVVKIKRRHNTKILPGIDTADLSEAEEEALIWKPTLSLSKYKKLIDKTALDEFIEVSEGLPSITLIKKEG
jgi:hypothetical protein